MEQFKIFSMQMGTQGESDFGKNTVIFSRYNWSGSKTNARYLLNSRSQMLFNCFK